MKFKVGDKVRVLGTDDKMIKAKVDMIGKICEVCSCECGNNIYDVWQPDKKDYWAFGEHELEPVAKRGRPRKGEESHKTKSCREEVNALKKELKAIKSELKEFKDAVETNICNLGLDQPEEKKVELTDAEQVILENLDKKFKWIARDLDGDIVLCEKKPNKNLKYKWWLDGDYSNTLPCPRLFQFIQWSDDKPYEIAKLLEG